MQIRQGGLNLSVRIPTTTGGYNTMPAISVLMPAYNTPENYLREAIESVLSQTFSDFELFVIDDCSPLPVVADVVRTYNDPRLKYLKTEQNGGAAATRNFGIAQTSGRYLAFIDADDAALPERFARQFEYLESHPETGVLGTGYKVIPADRITINNRSDRQLLLETIFVGSQFCQSSMMLRKSVLTDNNIFYRKDRIPAEDYALWMDLAGKTVFHILPEVLTLYRFHPQNLSTLQADKQYMQTCDIIFQKWQSFTPRPLDQEVITKFLSRATMSTEEIATLGKNISDLLSGVQKQNPELYPGALALLCRQWKRLVKAAPDRKMLSALLKEPIKKTLRPGCFFNLKHHIRTLFLPQ